MSRMACACLSARSASSTTNGIASASSASLRCRYVAVCGVWFVGGACECERCIDRVATLLSAFLRCWHVSVCGVRCERGYISV